jgi:hypothetical protein
MPRFASRAIVLLALSRLAAGEAPAVIDQWYVGDLNGQPAVSMHLVSSPVADGGRSTLAEMSMVLRRPMPGQTFRIEIRQRQELTEDAQGRISAFRIDNDENGQRTSANGHIDNGKVIADVRRLERVEHQEFALAPGVELLGQIESPERMASAVAAATAGTQPIVAFAGLELVRGQVAVVGSSARFVGPDAGGNLVFAISSDALPGISISTVVNPRGELVSQSFDLALFRIDVRRAPGPVALLGSEVDAAGMVAVKGGMPKGGAVERYRLPPGSTVPAGPFQAVDGDLGSCRSEAVPGPPPDLAPFLAREPQLETDDPDLRAWVAGLVVGHDDPFDKAEALRVAVRGRITTRDLSTADGSALQAFRSQRGDCTEHANLLCAVLRIAGIPAQVDVGLICVERAPAPGKPAPTPAWCGHAWVSAWIGDRWIHLDAAYPGVPRSRYIRLGSGSGADGVQTGGALATALVGLMGREIETLPPP